MQGYYCTFNDTIKRKDKMIFIGLCHKCYESNVQTELVNDSPLCLKCKVVKELKNELKNESDAKK